MGRFTVEETNLICIYIADNRAELIEEITGRCLSWTKKCGRWQKVPL